MTKSTLQDRLDADFATAWKPSPGDVLVGEVTQLSERDGGYGPYPIVTVRKDNGEELAFHAYHTVAANQLAEQRPAIGETIGIRYKGKVKGEGPHGDYHGYSVKVDRPNGASLDWSRYGEVERPAVADGNAGTPAPAADAEQHDDIPF